MKTSNLTKILILLTLSISGVSYGQLKHFFPRTNAYHSVEAIKLFFEGDTLINDKVYIKLYAQELLREKDPNFSTEADFDKAIYCGAVREDTLGERYYFYDHTKSCEYLICDFSLKVGDTARIWSMLGPPSRHGWEESPGGYQPSPITIDKIDSVLINGTYRKRLLMNVPGKYSQERGWEPKHLDEWIEGIGSSSGLLWAGVYFERVWDAWYPYLLCVHENNKVIYNPSTICYRDWSTSIESSKTEIQFSIYPTISSQSIYINSANAQFAYYSITSLIGKGGKIQPLNGNEIEISHLSQGMYLLQLYDGQKHLVGIRKFFKI